MNFKNMLKFDIENVFMNTDELAAKHYIEGVEITCIVDDEALRERQSGSELGVSESSLLIFAHTSDLPYKKGAGEHINLDGREYIVDTWDENLGITQIALTQSITA